MDGIQIDGSFQQSKQLADGDRAELHLAIDMLSAVVPLYWASLDTPDLSPPPAALEGIATLIVDGLQHRSRVTYAGDRPVVTWDVVEHGSLPANGHIGGGYSVESWAMVRIHCNNDGLCFCSLKVCGSAAVAVAAIV